MKVYVFIVDSKILPVEFKRRIERSVWADASDESESRSVVFLEFMLIGPNQRVQVILPDLAEGFVLHVFVDTNHLTVASDALPV